jgi:hypothetical protein
MGWNRTRFPFTLIQTGILTNLHKSIAMDIFCGLSLVKFFVMAFCTHVIVIKVEQNDHESNKCGMA